MFWEILKQMGLFSEGEDNTQLEGFCDGNAPVAIDDTDAESMHVFSIKNPFKKEKLDISTEDNFIANTV